VEKRRNGTNRRFGSWHVYGLSRVETFGMCPEAPGREGEAA
jgi:hypothetical protein